eukprot:365186-Chlamydomonas_euryale.AAC.9
MPRRAVNTPPPLLTHAAWHSMPNLVLPRIQHVTGSSGLPGGQAAQLAWKLGHRACLEDRQRSWPENWVIGPAWRTGSAAGLETGSSGLPGGQAAQLASQLLASYTTQGMPPAGPF